MKKLSYLLLLFLLLIIVLLAIIFNVSYQDKTTLFLHVDDLKAPPVPALMWYVLTWPPTFCLKLRPPAQCIKPIRDHEFTLHGLWPADANGKTISCTITVPVDWDKLIRPRESRLKTFWPELKENQPKYSIWKHEWEKHGVCGLTTAEQYFDAAIRTNGLFTRGNLYNYLASSSIVSSDHVAYTQDDIIKAIQTVFAPAPALGVYLRCTAIDSTNTTHGYLSEAVVCTTMDGSSFVTCPPRARNCDKFPHIVIPPRPPRALVDKVDLDRERELASQESTGVRSVEEFTSGLSHIEKEPIPTPSQTQNPPAPPVLIHTEL